MQKLIQQYGDLRRERTIIENTIKQLEKTLNNNEKYLILGRNSFKMAEREDTAEIRQELQKQIEALKEVQAKVLRHITEIELRIADIDDSMTRQIITYRCLYGYSWARTAEAIGGGNTAHSVRMALNRALSK